MRKIKKCRVVLLTAALLLCGLGAVFRPADRVWAAETETLSGKVEDLEMGTDVKKIILDGVRQSEGSISIPNDVEVEIKTGSRNTLHDITAGGKLQFTGAGELEIGCIFAYTDTISFDHSGTISVKGDGICNYGGDIIFNSGTVRCEVDSGDIFPVIAYEGNVIMNGGSLTAMGVVGALYGGVGIDLEGGRITAIATDGAAFIAGKGETGCLTIGESFEPEEGLEAGEAASNQDGKTVSTVVDAKGAAVAGIEWQAPDNEEQIQAARSALAETMYTDPQYEEPQEADTADTDEQQAYETGEGENQSSHTFTMLLLLLIVATVALAAFLTVRSDKKRRKL